LRGVETLRVLTLNVWNRQGPWERRRELIRRGIEQLKPDLVGLQEILHHDQEPRDQADELADGLGFQACFGEAWHIGGGLRFGNAVLSRHPITRQQLWALPGADDEPRALLLAEIDAPCGRVPFFVTHLNWKLHHGWVRLDQVRFIAERIAEAAPIGASFPPILVGDFNAEPPSDEIRFLRGFHVVDGKSPYFADVFDWLNPGAPGFTFARENSFAALAHEPSRRLDYVFVRGPDRQLRGEPIAARVVLDRGEDGVFPSDHYGVFAELHAAPRGT
jgi:endonuclease/exonuclease/phosphatase family metal-dependent hydrolase